MNEKKKVIISVAGAVVVVAVLVGTVLSLTHFRKGNDDTNGDIQSPQPTVTLPVETTTPEPTEDIIFIPDDEGVPDEEPPAPEWEEPPVMTVYNPAADLNNDGHVDKEEWQTWVDEHPEDLNQDLYISEEEQAEFNRPVETPTPSTSLPTPTPSQAPSTPPQETKQPVETPPPAPVVPTPSAADEAIGPSDDELDNWGMDEEGLTQEEIDRRNENASKDFDPIG